MLFLMFSTIVFSLYLLFSLVVVVWKYSKRLPPLYGDFEEEMGHKYLVMIDNGEKRARLSCSIIKIILNGRLRSSTPFLIDTAALKSQTGRTLFNASSKEYFLINSSESLGKLESLTVGLMSFCSDEYWYIKRIIISDLEICNSYPIIVKRYVTTQDMLCVVITYPLSREFSWSLWASNVWKCLREHHLWISPMTSRTFLTPFMVTSSLLLLLLFISSLFFFDLIVVTWSLLMTNGGPHTTLEQFSLGLLLICLFFLASTLQMLLWRISIKDLSFLSQFQHVYVQAQNLSGTSRQDGPVLQDHIQQSQQQQEQFQQPEQHQSRHTIRSTPVRGYSSAELNNTSHALGDPSPAHTNYAHHHSMRRSCLKRYAQEKHQSLSIDQLNDHQLHSQTKRNTLINSSMKSSGANAPSAGVGNGSVVGGSFKLQTTRGVFNTSVQNEGVNFGCQGDASQGSVDGNNKDTIYLLDRSEVTGSNLTDVLQPFRGPDINLIDGSMRIAKMNGINNNNNNNNNTIIFDDDDDDDDNNNNNNGVMDQQTSCSIESTRNINEKCPVENNSNINNTEINMDGDDDDDGKSTSLEDSIKSINMWLVNKIIDLHFIDESSMKGDEDMREGIRDDRKSKEILEVEARDETCSKILKSIFEFSNRINISHRIDKSMTNYRNCQTKDYNRPPPSYPQKTAKISSPAEVLRQTMMDKSMNDTLFWMRHKIINWLEKDIDWKLSNEDDATSDDVKRSISEQSYQKGINLLRSKQEAHSRFEPARLLFEERSKKMKGKLLEDVVLMCFKSFQDIKDGVVPGDSKLLVVEIENFVCLNLMKAVDSLMSYMKLVAQKYFDEQIARDELKTGSPEKDAKEIMKCNLFPELSKKCLEMLILRSYEIISKKEQLESSMFGFLYVHLLLNNALLRIHVNIAQCRGHEEVKGERGKVNSDRWKFNNFSEFLDFVGAEDEFVDDMRKWVESLGIDFNKIGQQTNNKNIRQSKDVILKLEKDDLLRRILRNIFKKKFECGVNHQKRATIGRIHCSTNMLTGHKDNGGGDDDGDDDDGGGDDDDGINIENNSITINNYLDECMKSINIDDIFQLLWPDFVGYISRRTADVFNEMKDRLLCLRFLELEKIQIRFFSGDDDVYVFDIRSILQINDNNEGDDHDITPHQQTTTRTKHLNLSWKGGGDFKEKFKRISNQHFYVYRSLVEDLEEEIVEETCAWVSHGLCAGVLDENTHSDDEQHKSKYSPHHVKEFMKLQEITNHHVIMIRKKSNDTKNNQNNNNKNNPNNNKTDDNLMYFADSPDVSIFSDDDDDYVGGVDNDYNYNDCNAASDRPSPHPNPKTTPNKVPRLSNPRQPRSSTVPGIDKKTSLTSPLLLSGSKCTQEKLSNAGSNISSRSCITKSNPPTKSRGDLNPGRSSSTLNKNKEVKGTISSPKIKQNKLALPSTKRDKFASPNKTSKIETSVATLSDCSSLSLKSPQLVEVQFDAVESMSSSGTPNRGIKHVQDWACLNPTGLSQLDLGFMVEVDEMEMCKNNEEPSAGELSESQIKKLLKLTLMEENKDSKNPSNDQDETHEDKSCTHWATEHPSSEIQMIVPKVQSVRYSTLLRERARILEDLGIGLVRHRPCMGALGDSAMREPKHANLVTPGLLLPNHHKDDFVLCEGDDVGGDNYEDDGGGVDNDGDNVTCTQEKIQLRTDEIGLDRERSIPNEESRQRTYQPRDNANRSSKTVDNKSLNRLKSRRNGNQSMEAREEEWNKHEKTETSPSESRGYRPGDDRKFSGSNNASGRINGSLSSADRMVKLSNNPNFASNKSPYKVETVKLGDPICTPLSKVLTLFVLIGLSCVFINLGLVLGFELGDHPSRVFMADVLMSLLLHCLLLEGVKVLIISLYYSVYVGRTIL